MVYIAQEGMSTQDLFRRPGNPNDTRRIVKRMSEGKPVIYQNYNMYTLASVVKVGVSGEFLMHHFICEINTAIFVLHTS